MVRFKNVTKSYGENLVVKNLNLEINDGQFVVLIGTSGCGKTTTLKMINKLMRPSSGEIYINGEDIRTLNSVELRRKIGYVIQQTGLFPNMTVAENIQVVPKLLGWNTEKCEARTRELLDMVGLPYDEYAHKYPNEMSGGQQQRVGVMRALAAEPPIILMDEPFGALDPITRDNLQDEVKRLHKQLKKTIIFVTHDMNEAIKLADVIVFMHEGEIVQMASPEELLSKPANKFVKEFIGKHTNGSSSSIATIKDLMKKEVVSVTRDKKTYECISLMNHKKVNMLIVTDDNGSYEGTVNIKDIKNYGEAGKSIESLINDETITIYEDMDTKEAFDTLLDAKAEYLVVISKTNKVVGLVTRTTIVKAMADALWGESND